jgi:hypothetical protein
MQDESDCDESSARAGPQDNRSFKGLEIGAELMNEFCDLTMRRQWIHFRRRQGLDEYTHFINDFHIEIDGFAARIRNGESHVFLSAVIVDHRK